MNESKMLRERLFRWLVARGLVLSLGTSILVYAVLTIGRLLLQAPAREPAPLFSMPCFLVSVAVFVALSAAMAVLARRRLPSREAFTAWIDDRNAFGGIPLAEGRPGSEPWLGRLNAPKAIRFKVDFRREASLLALSILFLGTVFICPRTLAEIDEEHRLDINDEAAEIEEKIQILEQSGELSAEKVEEFKEMLESIRENGFADDSSKTYEQLDVLEERVDNEISSLQNTLVNEETSMEMLAKALDALSKVGGEFASTASEEIAKFISELAEMDPELADILSELAKTDAEMSPSELARRTADKSLTKEQCEKLAEALRKNADRIKEKLRQMAEQRKNCSGGECSTAGLCENPVPFDEKSLEEWLNSNCPETAGSLSCAMESGASGGKPGEGSVGKGKGDAPLDYSGKAQDFEGKFNEFGVDGMAKAAETSVINRTLSAPINAEKDAERAGEGALRGGNAEAESKGKSVHPQHRRAVKQYFGE